MRLDHYHKGNFEPGVSLPIQLAWFFLGHPLVRSRLFTPSPFKVAVLRLFGAQIGQSVRVKPGVRVKFPWRLQIGDYSWIGEDVWIDNLAPVTIGKHCCISQGAYFCTGNHDWSKSSFDLTPKPIRISDHAWIGARSTLGPGVEIGEGSVLTLSSVATENLEAWSIYLGHPARRVGPRPSPGATSHAGE